MLLSQLGLLLRIDGGCDPVHFLLQVACLEQKLGRSEFSVFTDDAGR